jgi:Domain of unknown function (DUF5666)
MLNHASKSFVLAIALGLSFLAARATAQSTPAGSLVSAQDSSSFSLQGKITKLEAGKFAVNTEENILFHVRYDDKTSITRPDGSAGTEKDLKTGAWVKVRGDLEESGEIAATTIKLLDKEPSKD